MMTPKEMQCGWTPATVVAAAAAVDRDDTAIIHINRSELKKVDRRIQMHSYGIGIM